MKSPRGLTTSHPETLHFPRTRARAEPVRTQTLRSKGSSQAGGVAGQVSELLHFCIGLLWTARVHLAIFPQGIMPVYPYSFPFCSPSLGLRLEHLWRVVGRGSLCPRAAW